MTQLSSFLLPIRALAKGTHSFCVTLDAGYFHRIEGPEISEGDVEVDIVICKRDHISKIRIGYTGTIETTCDRCLEPLSIDVDNDRTIYVKYGVVRQGYEFEEESDDTFVIDENAEGLNIEWLLYEFLALEIPICHTHPDGDCNPEMMGLLNGLRIESATGNDDDANLRNEGEKEIDPRWNALKDLIKN